jgi:hypothetical protein
MTDDTIERLAREAGAFTPGRSGDYWAVTDEALARFAALVRADALEQAAKACEMLSARTDDDTGATVALRWAAEEIRALSAP